MQAIYGLRIAFTHAVDSIQQRDPERHFKVVIKQVASESVKVFVLLSVIVRTGSEVFTVLTGFFNQISSPAIQIVYVPGDHL